MTTDNNLGFDIISDQQGADLLSQFYNPDTNKQDPPVQDPEPIVNPDPKNTSSNTDEPDKKDELDNETLLDLLKNQGGNDDDPDKKDDDKKDDKKDQAPKVNTGVFGVLYEDFKDRGLIDEIEDFDGTEEGFLKAYQESIFKKAEELKEQELDEIFSGNPKNKTVGKEFLSFLAKGGDPQDFVDVYSQKEYSEEDVKKSEAVQERVMREFLRLSGLSEEKITAKIDRMKTLESLEEEAVDAFEVLKVQKEKQKENLIKQADDQKKVQAQRIEEFNKNIVSTVNENTELFGFHLGKDTKAKRDLIDYMFKPTEKTENGAMVPKFALDRQKVVADPKWVLLQALALKNDMDFSKVVETVQTKVTKSLKEKLEGADDLRKNKGENRLDNSGNGKSKLGNLEELLSNTMR